jgi:glycosyltransferase involved in cell wall biosynthesis
MRVGLNLLYLVPGETGGRETYARELVPALLEHAPDLELVAFVNREAGSELAIELTPAVRTVVLPISARNRAQWAMGELAVVSLAARRAEVEVLHSMANFSPAWGRFRRVVTIHDLQYQVVPELLSWQMRAGTTLLMSIAARRAERIIAVSAAGRDEIVTGLRVDPWRIDVVPNGVRPPRPSAATPEAVSLARKRLEIDEQAVVLAVASNLPHKNLAALVDALAIMPPDSRPVVLFAGHGTDDGELARRAAAAGVHADVRTLGMQSGDELETLYGLADCLALPTLHEGFGLPVLEAMARSLPVLCSDIPALREVAGDAAAYFDPRAPSDIAATIEKLLREPVRRERMLELGRLRAASFSWAEAAAETLASYRRALQSPSRGSASAGGPA